MSLLGRARRMWQGWSPPPPPAPQYYRVTCVEGHSLQGRRTEGYQALRCPTCGGGIFVLPVSPLPDPPAPAPSSPARRTRTGSGSGPVSRPRPEAEDDRPIALSDPEPDLLIDEVPPDWQAPTRPDTSGEVEIEFGSEMGARSEPETDADLAEIEWLDVPPSELSPSPPGPKPAPRPRPATSAAGAAPVRPRPPARPAQKASPAAAAAAGTAAPGPASRTILVPERPGLWQRIRQRPHRLVFAAVVLLVVSTVAVRLWQRQLQDLPRIAEVGRAEGMAALESGEFDTAKRRLAEAARAVRLMRGRFEGSDEILHAAAEAAIYADLIPRTLEQLLDEAASTSEDQWSYDFEIRYQGRSIIVQATVIATPGAGGSASGYDLDYRVFGGPGPDPIRVGRLDLTDFQLFEQLQPSLGDQVAFGARLAAVELGARDLWRIRLEPDSGVILRYWDSLEAVADYPWTDTRKAE